MRHRVGHMLLVMAAVALALAAGAATLEAAPKGKMMIVQVDGNPAPGVYDVHTLSTHKNKPHTYRLQAGNGYALFRGQVIGAVAVHDGKGTLTALSMKLDVPQQYSTAAEEATVIPPVDKYRPDPTLTTKLVVVKEVLEPRVWAVSDTADKLPYVLSIQNSAYDWTPAPGTVLSIQGKRSSQSHPRGAVIEIAENGLVRDLNAAD